MNVLRKIQKELCLSSLHSAQPPAKILAKVQPYAGKFVLLALAGVAWHNWRLWQRDKGLLSKDKEPAPLVPLEKWPELPLVSVLVAAWNEIEHIDRHIQSFLALRYPNKELILCAGGHDGTYERASRYAAGASLALAVQAPKAASTLPIKVFEQQPGEGKQRALARCFSHTQGAIIFLTDADCVLDNESFERTLYPLAAGLEEASTGTSKPDGTQLKNPFVAAQMASQLYSDLQTPPYSEGLFGRNGAVTRRLLEQSQALAADAPTGTDYVLAKMLVQAGARIRQVPESRIVTDYPATIGAYVRQQRRWVRNVALHGLRFGALSEVKSSLQSSLIGLMMLLLPFGKPLFGTPLLVVWGLLLWHAFLSRLRYLYLFGSIFAIPVPLRQVILQPGMLFLDFIAWSQPLLDYLLPQRQKEW